MKTTVFVHLLLCAVPLAALAAKQEEVVELEGMAIIGNRELPKSLFIVPWKPPELGDLVGRPSHSLLDEQVEPLDREEFLRQLQYQGVGHTAR